MSFFSANPLTLPKGFAKHKEIAGPMRTPAVPVFRGMVIAFAVEAAAVFAVLSLVRLVHSF